MWRRQGKAGLSVIEILVVICAVLFLLLGFWVYRQHCRANDAKIRCASNLRQIAVAVNMYMGRFGDQNFYPVPTGSFRGDCWLATLYWTSIITEPNVFICPASDDDASLLPATRPADLSLASAIPDKGMSYAGRCHGLKGKYGHRNTAEFTCPAFGRSPSVLACDKNRKKQNHAGGMNVVYFDSGVKFIEGDRADTYDLIGAPGSKFEKFDGGEE